jgi:hypothetical protein
MLVFYPRFAGSNLAESDEFLRAIRICSLTSFSGKVKPLVPSRKILQHVKDPLRHDRDSDGQNSAAISCTVFLSFAIRCLCCNQSRELVDESGMVRTKMRQYNRSENGCSCIYNQNNVYFNVGLLLQY